MELVYLWVEEYKNIRNQGFNFSPRFECEFDGENLTITENEDYVSIFPDNINVTAIVGENGSGKSSVIKLIFLLIYLKNYELMDKGFKAKSAIIDMIYNKYLNKNIFLLFAKKDNKQTSYYKISLLYTLKKYYEKTLKLSNENNQEKINTMKNCILSYDNLVELTQLDFYSIHFNYMLDTFYDGKTDNWIKDIYHKVDSYQTPLLLEPYKNYNNKQQINLDIIEYLNNQNMLRFFSKFDSDKKMFNFFQPNKIIFKIATRKKIDVLKPVLSKKKEIIENEYRSIFYKFTELYDAKQFPKIGKNKAKLRSIYNRINNLYKKGDYEEISYLYIALKVLSSKYELFHTEPYKIISEWAKSLEVGDNLLSFQQSLNIDNLINHDIASQYEVRKIQTNIDFINHQINNSTKFTSNINKITDITEVSDILTFLPSWLDVEWFENDKSIKSLSSGEKAFFTLIINILYQVQNINNRAEYQVINLFLDETELGFHPKWQKEYLQNLIEYLEIINKKAINLIFATHSPFILSDIPKKNVIFLKNGKQDNPDIRETFGANIHTLLSHGFFMENGLMGEFAKKTIQDVINYLNDKPTQNMNKQKAWQIIQLIGEPFLKHKLEEKYNEKFLTKEEQKQNKIKQLKNELERLKDDNTQS